eukprot:gb/GFBE01037323.1/.p1 GENE.gb/GFBE01037323.1/~~gb/GFBE01037323.1/.p1  ORF type:complete len:267 (+),score=55.77 gb/GFBE01037323.1/:1-801(+)
MHTCNEASAWSHGLALLLQAEAWGLDQANGSGPEGPGADTSNAALLNSALAACSLALRWQSSLELLARAQKRSVRQDTVSVNTAANAAEKDGLWQTTLELLLDGCRHGCGISVVGCNTALSACYKENDEQEARSDEVSHEQRWQLALRVFSRARLASLQVDGTSCSVAVASCSSFSKWRRALGLILDADVQGQVPDVASFDMAVVACAKQQQWRYAVQLLDAMRLHGLVPGEVGFSVAIQSVMNPDKLIGTESSALPLKEEACGCD